MHLPRLRDMGRHLAALTLGALMTVAGAPSIEAQQITVAGSPKDTIHTRDYAALFANLRANGIDTYFPTFQYVEVPRPRSLGFETDFALPCKPTDPGFVALRESGLKLIVPGEFVYPNPNAIRRGKPQKDPLRKIMDCAGPGVVSGITNYDEAAMHGIPESAVAALYARVKEVAPEIPVYMVHGPIIGEGVSKREAEGYLDMVRAYSRHADIVGFDVYPIPISVSKMATPYSGGKIVREETAVGEYARWLNANFPNKEKLMVLQGFAYTHLYEESFLARNVPAEVRALIPPPSEAELTAMIDQSRAHGVDHIIFWGVSALESGSHAPWPAILNIARRRN